MSETRRRAHNAIDYSGKRFGQYTILHQIEGAKRTQWVCLCDCGAKWIVDGTSIRTTLSCGCARVRANIKRTKHGHSRRNKTSSTYRIWSGMVKRCTNPKSIAWPYYGGRGITVDERWKDFAEFLKDMGERPANLTIDRINNDDGYYKGNCRWATRLQQVHNRRKPVRVPKRGGSLVG